MDLPESFESKWFLRIAAIQFLLAAYGSFELYGFLGLIATLPYAIIVPILIHFYYKNKRKKISLKNQDDYEDLEAYHSQENLIDIKEVSSYVFLWFVPLSSIVIIYLYFEVKYGVLYALLFIMFYSYNIRLSIGILREILPRQASQSSRYHDKYLKDELDEHIEILRSRLDKLYDFTDFDEEKLSEIHDKKARAAIIVRLLDSDLKNNWIEKLWQWADLYGASEYDIPRDKDKLVGNIADGIIFFPSFTNMNISTIPSEIGYLNTSIGLDFTMNNIIQIPKEIGNMSDLENLNFRLNEIKHIPSELGKLKNLTTLDISSNRLTVLPIEITTIPYLQELILHNNPIQRLPDELYNMKHLEKITVDSSVDISSKVTDFLGDKLEIIDSGWIQGLWDWAEFCKLEENIIPRNKTDLLNLESLKLSPYDLHLLDTSSNYPSSHRVHIDIAKYTNIAKLPKEIGNLTRLKELSLERTRITKLPVEIGNLTNLEVLSLDSTDITELPFEITKLKKLKKLLMRNTMIDSIPAEIQNMENLKIWSIDRNS